MRLNRLVNLNIIKTYALEAVDGEIGRFEDIYFEDSYFMIRYLVVNTGGWLSGRKVLLSPFTVGEFDEQNRILFIELTQEQIEHSPPMESNLPVSREYEINYFKYYGWPPYWESAPWPTTPSIPAYPANDSSQDNKVRNFRPEENHLRSSNEIQGYGIITKNGDIGHVKSFIIDTQYWTVRYLEVDTRKWLRGGKYVLISPAWITQISWPDNRLTVDLSREALQNAPEYDEKKPVSREYELRLFNYYGKEMYWK
jgi:uncharacterized protein YrrD